MGATQSTSSTSSATTSVIQIPVEEGLFPEGQGGFSLASSIEAEAVLKRYGFCLGHSLPAGSGRMTKTFQLKRRGPNQVESTAVVKAAWILEQPCAIDSTTNTSSSSS